MAHFAKLGANGKVIQVLTMDNDKMLNADGVEDETVGQQWLEQHNNWPAQMWIQTSYNTSRNTHKSGDNSKAFRGNYAGIGYTYLAGQATLGVGSTDIFISQQPYASWTVGVNTAQWYPPANPGAAPALTTAEQDARKSYVWNESNYQSDPATAWVLTSP